MVVLPAGSFTMGTPDDEVGRQPDEGPLHDVTFAKPFAISRYQVTAGELDAYLKATGVKLADGDTRPGRECIAGKPRYQQGPRQPAVCVDYNDVKNYAAWLSKKTGKHYRMLSEAEREYGARAGSAGPFPSRSTKARNTASPSTPTPTAPAMATTSPRRWAASPNAFGVYDMHGNVYEWVADCWHDHYNGAPSDGSAWMEDKCELVQIRGNDWGEPPIFSRSGNRNNAAPSDRGDWIGFRVAREL